jgi:hypothetical protein
MQLEKLKKLGERYKEYQGSIDSVTKYLSELEGMDIDVIQPKIFAKRLNLPYSTALHILSLAEKYDVVKRSYQVFSTLDKTPIGEYHSTQEIPPKVRNPATDELLGREQYFVDLIFHLEK